MPDLDKLKCFDKHAATRPSTKGSLASYLGILSEDKLVYSRWKNVHKSILPVKRPNSCSDVE
jgi:hypothetical protein